MRHLLMWSCLVMTLSRPALCDVPAPEDFALGFTVESETQGALWELDLPDAVYRSVTQADLGDIRVFNNAGQVIPHVLRMPGMELEQVPAPTAVPFYSLQTRDEEDTPGQRLRIITDEKGTIVDAVSTAAPSDEAERTTAYLLDFTALERTPERLTLAWERPGNASFAVSVEVASSDDLSHWSTLVKEVTLADLQSGEALLVHNEIKLPARRARYLRVTWPEALREVVLSGVLASFPAATKPLPHRWLEIPGAPDQDDARVINFDTGGHWPADTARMDFASSNVVVRAELMSRPTQESDWNARYSGIFYTLDHEGKALESELAVFAKTSDRYWRFRLADQERQLAGSLPTLVLGWMPHVLTFVAEGKPPYTVAFGSATVAAAARPVDALLRSIDEDQEKGLVVPVEPSPVFTLGGDAKLEPPAAPFPWRTLLLWTVLLAGVAMLAWMVRGLFRQMATPGSSTGKHD
ncbi:MAG: DUF3999 domain-containing protein [Pseudomonadota bacterium]